MKSNGTELPILTVSNDVQLKDAMTQSLRQFATVRSHFASRLNLALESFRAYKPKIIFCDIRFSDAGIIELLDGIGGTNALGEPFVVMMVDEYTKENLALAKELGVADVLSHPFSGENLQVIVDRYNSQFREKPTPWRAEYEKAFKAFLEHRPLEAEFLYAKLEESYPKEFKILMDCSHFWLKRARPDRAESTLRAALELQPDSIRGLSMLASALRHRGEYEQSVEFYKLANEKSPLNSRRNLELAETYARLAEHQLQLALGSDSENGSLIITKAKLQMFRKDYQGAVHFLYNRQERLTESNKREADFWMIVGKKMVGVK